jgi:transcriptional regulator, AraC family with amidase-like domain
MQAKTDNPASLDIGLLLYPGAQRAAVHGLADLFLVANRVVAELGPSSCHRCVSAFGRQTRRGSCSLPLRARLPPRSICGC